MMLDAFYTDIWAQVTLASLLVAVAAWLGDWRQGRRRHIEAVGFMPWTAIMVMAMMLALVAAALAIGRG